MNDKSNAALPLLSKPAHKTLTSATAETLRSAIDSGAFPSGSQLPSEMELIPRLGVSRTTLREALRTLENEGLIERRRGLGTFVSAKPIIKDFGSNYGITEMITQAGLIPGASSATVRNDKASIEVADALHIAEGAPVIIVDRVRTASQCPVVWTVDTLPEALFGKPSAARFHPETQSLYHFLAHELEIHLARGTAVLRPVAAGRDAVAKLGVKRGTPLLLVTQTDFDQSNQPVLYSIEYHLPNVFVFLINRRGPYGHTLPKTTD